MVVCLGVGAGVGAYLLWWLLTHPHVVICERIIPQTFITWPHVARSITIRNEATQNH